MPFIRPQPRFILLHNIIIASGLLVGLGYLPVWTRSILGSFTTDPSFSCLVAISAGMGLHKLWVQRQALLHLRPSIVFRCLGYTLILFGIGLFGLGHHSFSGQAGSWLLTLVGIALSCWGLSFFRRYSVAAFLMMLSVHPGWQIVLGTALRSISVPTPFETVAAVVSGFMLKFLGYELVVRGNYIDIQGVDILVDYPCNGFDSAMTMMIAGLLVSIALHRSRLQTLKLVLSGAMIALFFNAVRVTILAIAANQGNDAAFNFWHGPEGGQIFSVLLFTLYSVMIKFFPVKATEPLSPVKQLLG
jgi:exosortase/archaeosortase family protein